MDKCSNGIDVFKNRIDLKFIFFNEVLLKVNDVLENMIFWIEWKFFEFFDDDSGVNEELLFVLECGGVCICSVDCCY